VDWDTLVYADMDLRKSGYCFLLDRDFPRWSLLLPPLHLRVCCSARNASVVVCLLVLGGAPLTESKFR